MQNILDNIKNPSTNIDIIGNIFICDELCNLSVKYNDHSNLSISQNDILLSLNYDNNSFITYNGNDEFGSQNIKYILKNIILIGPAKHFIKSYRRNSVNNMGLELILIHQSEDKQRYQNISVLLY